MTTPSAPNRILAIGAHPDDLEFGCGGLLLKEAESGTEISLVVCSKGESGSSGSAAIREAETRAAADMLGATDRLHFLDFGGDGTQRETPDNAMQIARLIREIQPHQVLAPTPHANQHPDHRVVSQLSRDACRLARYGGLDALKDLPVHRIESLWFYAVTSLFETSNEKPVLIDITAQFERWQQLMACHQSQVKSRAYLDLQNSRARQLGLISGVDYAQALWPNDPLVIHDISTFSKTARGY